MTSEENNEETISFFEKNNYFDYPQESIKFFKQGEMPLIGKTLRCIVLVQTHTSHMFLLRKKLVS